ncbi:type II toxin-antitoxin system Phd/YefM family antitoxin [Methylococcus geothermalis]|uniref:Antitoxin n=1 Tax=Methylococcus geothermalis TaxID=2681310 RepID=A0A858Q8C7_9GAMM|nr:type II toxin-antitoxin system prevent-host-death family antitoxin [Methylococcus geothermalis]QJD30055.1 type II toxin-antitoxin system prevent-host-death family antitoxin [Methylococcus geothermalis]
MKTTSIADTKSHLSALLADIEAGEELVITRRGKPVARLVAEPRAEGFGWSDLRTRVAQGATPTQADGFKPGPWPKWPASAEALGLGLIVT